MELLAGPRGLQRRALHRAHLDLDPNRAEIARDGLARREVGRVGIEVAGVEAVRIAGFGEELSGLRRIVGIGLERQRELELARDHGAGEAGRSERLGLVQRPAVDRIAYSEPHAAVVPGGLRVPLVEELQEVDADRAGKCQLQVGIALHFQRRRRV